MTLLRECVRLHFKLYLMPLPSPRSGFVQHDVGIDSDSLVMHIFSLVVELSYRSCNQ